MQRSLQNLFETFPFMKKVMGDQRLHDSNTQEDSYPILKTQRKWNFDDISSKNFLIATSTVSTKRVPLFLDILFGFYSNEVPKLVLNMQELGEYDVNFLETDVDISPTGLTALWGFIPRPTTKNRKLFL